MKEFNLSKEYIHSEFGILGIREFSDNDLELVKSTLLLIKETLHEDLSRLDQVVENRNYSHLKSVCHKMKPNFELIGLLEISFLLNQIEQELNTEEEAYSNSKVLINLKPTITELIDNQISELET